MPGTQAIRAASMGHATSLGINGRSGGRRAGQAARQSSANAAGRTSAAAGVGQQFRHAAGSNTAAAASGGLLGETAGRPFAAAGAGQQFRHAAGSNTAAAASGGLLGETAGLTSAAAGTGGPFSQAAGRSSPDPASGCRSGHEDGRRSADPSAGGQLGQVAGWSSANTPTGAHLVQTAGRPTADHAPDEMRTIAAGHTSTETHDGSMFLPSCEPVPDAPFCPSAGMTSADPAVDGVLGQAAWRTDANPAAGVLLRPTARRIPDDTNTNGVFSPPGGAELGGHFGEANGRTWTNSGADEPLIPNAGGTEAGDAVGGQTGDAYGRATTHAADHELHGHVAEPTSDVEEARAAHRALQRENQRLLNELEELRRSLSRSTSPAETSGGAGEQQEPSPNSGNVAANVQPGRHPIVPINDRLLGRAVGNAHARGTEHGLQHLTLEQEVLAFDLAAAMRRVPEVNKGLYPPAMMLTGDINKHARNFALIPPQHPLSFSLPYNSTHISAAPQVHAFIVLTGDSGEVAEEFVLIPHLLLSTAASLFSPLNPSHPISQQSHCIVLTGDSREGAEDSVLIPPCLNSHFPPLSHVPSPNPFDGSYDLYTWHCNQNGVPFSNAVLTRLIAASFRRDGEDVLVLKLKQIAFWLYGVSECNVLF
ncbi:unnamed protein product [Closterium sp. NIES-64]|nr:unnamed protein product [Closterium sp. NIES-64]